MIWLQNMILLNAYSHQYVDISAPFIPSLFIRPSWNALGGAWPTNGGCLPINSLEVACSAISITSLLSTMHKSFRCSVKNYFVCIAVTGYRSQSHTVKHVLRGTIIAILINSLMPTVAIWVVGTATKHSVSDRVTSSVIFDIRALWRSTLRVRVPGCQKLQRMA